MSTINLTNVLKARPTSEANYSPIKWVSKRINFAQIGGTAGDTYQLISIPAESAVVAGFLVVTTEIADAGAVGTESITLKVNSEILANLLDTHTAAIPKGTVIQLFPSDYVEAVGPVLYVTAADTVDLLITTAIPATGVFDLHVGYISVIGNT